MSCLQCDAATNICHTIFDNTAKLRRTQKYITRGPWTNPNRINAKIFFHVQLSVMHMILNMPSLCMQIQK